MRDTAYKNYLLTVLLIILTFNYADRWALSVVQEDIKHDLGLTDTQLGLLSGIAFALFYSVMGLPIARWADRGNRVTIITLTTALWSAAVALCGAAGNFLQLLWVRIGVAVGEAGCIPPAHSLIADHFSRAERPRALAIYMLGGPLSMGVGYFVAGWLNDLYGWRATFVILGLPGLLLAALAGLTMKEPRRAHPATANTDQSPKLKEVWRALWANTTFRHLLFGFSVIYFFGFGIMHWQPTYFIRRFALESGPLGMGFALSSGLCGLIGTYAGGELASRRASQNEPLQLKVMGAACAAFGALYLCVYLSPSFHLAFGLIGLAAIGGAAINGPLFAAIQTVVPPRMRAMAIAIVFLFANLIGMGLGPLAVGVLSDQLRPWAGEESLRFALLVLCPGYAWGGWHLWRASRTAIHDLQG